MRGSTAKAAVDPVTLVAFLDERTTYVVDGIPPRKTRRLNGKRVSQDLDARIIRRWRSGRFEGVTVPAAKALLSRYDLPIKELQDFATNNNRRLMLRGELN